MKVNLLLNYSKFILYYLAQQAPYNYVNLTDNDFNPEFSLDLKRIQVQNLSFINVNQKKEKLLLKCLPKKLQNITLN